MPMNDRDLCFILCFSLKWWAWGTLLDRPEKKWLWSPLTIVTYPWRSASESRSGTTPAPRRVPRLDRRSKREALSPTFFSFFSLWTSSHTHSLKLVRLMRECVAPRGLRQIAFITQLTFCHLLPLLSPNLRTHPCGLCCQTTKSSSQRRLYRINCVFITHSSIYIFTVCLFFWKACMLRPICFVEGGDWKGAREKASKGS